MKLKTLKDLKDIDFAADNNNVIYGFSEVLKQEAIKWIKYKLNNQDLAVQKQLWMNEGTIFSFKKFFNITEEDLK